MQVPVDVIEADQGHEVKGRVLAGKEEKRFSAVQVEKVVNSFLPCEGVRLGCQKTPDSSLAFLDHGNTHVNRFGAIVTIILIAEEIHDIRIVRYVAVQHLAELLERDVFHTEDHHSIVGKLCRDHLEYFVHCVEGYGTFWQENEMEFFITGQTAGNPKDRHCPCGLLSYIFYLEKPAFQAKPCRYLGDEGVYPLSGGKIKVHCMFNDPHHNSGSEDFGEDVPGTVGDIHAVYCLPVGPGNFRDLFLIGCQIPAFWRCQIIEDHKVRRVLIGGNDLIYIDEPLHVDFQANLFPDLPFEG